MLFNGAAQQYLSRINDDFSALRKRYNDDHTQLDRANEPRAPASSGTDAQITQPSGSH